MVDASLTQGLAMAKRISIKESHAVMQKVKPKASEKVKPVVVVAKNLSGTNTILPFHGDLYDGQQLLKTGHKAKVAEKPQGIFGGLSAAIGNMSSSIVGTAHASNEQVIPTFLNDDLAAAGKIKRLDGKSKSIFSPSDHMPAYYNQPIYTYLDKDAFFSLQPVSVLKEEALANSMPSTIVYKRFDGKGDKADAKLHGIARLYVSGGKMLYRWKANESDVKKTGILGMDIVLPKLAESSFKKTHTEHLNAQVYYLDHGKIKVDAIILNIKLNKESKIEWRV